jgi:hypothetical protein
MGQDHVRGSVEGEADGKAAWVDRSPVSRRVVSLVRGTASVKLLRSPMKARLPAVHVSHYSPGRSLPPPLTPSAAERATWIDTET